MQMQRRKPVIFVSKSRAAEAMVLQIEDAGSITTMRISGKCCCVVGGRHYQGKQQGSLAGISCTDIRRRQNSGSAFSPSLSSSSFSCTNLLPFNSALKPSACPLVCISHIVFSFLHPLTVYVLGPFSVFFSAMADLNDVGTSPVKNLPMCSA
jgi:hypothetical protein